MLSSRIEILIQREITGKILPGEKDELNYWIDQSPENKQIFDEISKLWELSPEDELDVDVNSSWKSFKKRVINHNLVDLDLNRF